eukprot:1239889-Rhodomonas_salina.2
MLTGGGDRVQFDLCRGAESTRSGPAASGSRPRLSREGSAAGWRVNATVNVENARQGSLRFVSKGKLWGEGCCGSRYNKITISCVPPSCGSAHCSLRPAWRGSRQESKRK